MGLDHREGVNAASALGKVQTGREGAGRRGAAGGEQGREEGCRESRRGAVGLVVIRRFGAMVFLHWCFAKQVVTRPGGGLQSHRRARDLPLCPPHCLAECASGSLWV